MARTIQIKRGLEKNLPTLKPGEQAFTTDTKKVFIGSDTGNVDITNSVDTTKLATKTELGTVTAALADTAKKPEVQATNKRIDELIIGSGDANAEVTDAHVSLSKNKTFDTISKRIDIIEKDIGLIARNSIANGNFSSGKTNWNALGSTVTVSDNKAIVLGNGSANYSDIYQTLSNTFTAGDKVFISVFVKSKNSNMTQFRVQFRATSVTEQVITEASNPQIDTSLQLSGIWTVPSNINDLRVTIRGLYPDATTANGSTYEVSYITLINLTEAFGKGKEPVAGEVVKTLSAKFTNSWFEGSESLFYGNNQAERMKKIEDGQTETQKKIDNTNAVLVNNLKDISNVVNNASLTTNTTGWSPTAGTLALNQGVITFTNSGSTNYPLLTNVTNETPKKGDKYFVSLKAKVQSSDVSSLRFNFRDWVTGGTFHYRKEFLKPLNNQWITYNDVISVGADFTGNARVYVDVLYNSTTVANKKWDVKKWVVINLTKSFGAGKEPSREVMETLLSRFEETFFADTEKVLYDQTTQTSFQKIKRIEPHVARKKLHSSSNSRAIWTITYDDESKSIYDYALPVHKTEGVPGLFYIVPDRVGSKISYNYGIALEWEHLREMEQNGIEIGNHTFQHLVTTDMTKEQLRKNIETAQDIFAANGFYPKHFSHPGTYSNNENANVLRDYFETSRVGGPAMINYDLHPYKLKSASGDATFERTKSDIQKLAVNGGWYISYNHGIDPSGAIGEFAVWTPSQLQELIQYAKSLGIEIVSLDEGLRTYAPFQYYFTEQVDPIFSVQRNGKVINNSI